MLAALERERVSHSLRRRRSHSLRQLSVHEQASKLWELAVGGSTLLFLQKPCDLKLWDQSSKRLLVFPMHLQLANLSKLRIQ